jgi:hypothetical protein
MVLPSTSPSIRINEVRKLELGPNDLVVVRGDDLPDEWMQRLTGHLKTQHPEWRGTVVVLPIDVEIGALPEVTARKIYERLKVMFEGNPTNT